MNKADLVDEMAKKSGLTKKDAELALNAFTNSVQTAIQNKDKVVLVGFGTFEVRERAARKGMNPRTKQEISIPATAVPVFKPGKVLKEQAKTGQ
jgi:DNA-binding protein HU-beta